MEDDAVFMNEQILSKLKEHHPEYLSPDTTVTLSFIKEVNKAENLVSGNDCEMSDQMAKEIFDRLPDDVIDRPMDVKTIKLISRIHGLIYLEQFWASDADSDCSTSWQFNNRGNSRSCLGRYLEALEDFNQACNLEPENLMYLLNRARMFVELDMKKLALRDALQAYKQLQNIKHHSPDGYSAIDDAVHIAKIFAKCDSKVNALASLRKSITLLKTYLPYLSKMDEDGMCSGDSFSINVGIILDEILSTLNLLKENCLGQATPMINILIDELAVLKHEIGCGDSKEESYANGIAV